MKSFQELVLALSEFWAGAGCVLCRQPDFLRGAFGDRTILLCDQCEREFHVGCLPQPLTQVPQGRWYCSGECERRLRSRSQAGV